MVDLTFILLSNNLENVQKQPDNVFIFRVNNDHFKLTFSPFLSQYAHKEYKMPIQGRRAKAYKCFVSSQKELELSLKVIKYPGRKL